MTFEWHQKVLFKHCDPAGIVFFPRYFEMMNDCVEFFFAECLNMPFEVLHRVGGVPTAHIETRFVRPSRHGDRLVFRLDILQIGRSSARYRMKAHAEGELRFETEATLVHIDTNGRSAPWPEALRLGLAKYEVAQDDP